MHWRLAKKKLRWCAVSDKLESESDLWIMSVNKILSQLENTHLYLMKEIQVTALCYNRCRFNLEKLILFFFIKDALNW